MTSDPVVGKCQHSYNDEHTGCLSSIFLCQFNTRCIKALTEAQTWTTLFPRCFSNSILLQIPNTCCLALAAMKFRRARASQFYMILPGYNRVCQRLLSKAQQRC